MSYQRNYSSLLEAQKIHSTIKKSNVDVILMDKGPAYQNALRYFVGPSIEWAAIEPTLKKVNKSARKQLVIDSLNSIRNN